VHCTFCFTVEVIYNKHSSSFLRKLKLLCHEMGALSKAVLEVGGRWNWEHSGNSSGNSGGRSNRIVLLVFYERECLIV